MNTSEFYRQARDIADRIEKMNETTDWMKANREKEFNQPVQQVAPKTATPPQNKLETLTPAKIKQQFDLRGEDFIEETLAEIGRQFPTQPHENQTKKLPDPPLPRNHEEILKMVKKGDSTESILLRFQGVE